MNTMAISAFLTVASIIVLVIWKSQKNNLLKSFEQAANNGNHADILAHLRKIKGKRLINQYFDCLRLSNLKHVMESFLGSSKTEDLILFSSIIEILLPRNIQKIKETLNLAEIEKLGKWMPPRIFAILKQSKV